MRLPPVSGLVLVAAMAAASLSACQPPRTEAPSPAEAPDLRATAQASVSPVGSRCSATGMPPTAASLTLYDSTRYPRAELGTVYRYGDSTAQNYDVFVYPTADWSSPADQARETAEALEIEKRRGRIAEFSVFHQGPHVISAADGGKSIDGYRMLMRIKAPDGSRESYFALYPVGDRFVKIRVTYVPDAAMRASVEAFARDVVTALAAGLRCTGS